MWPRVAYTRLELSVYNANDTTLSCNVLLVGCEFSADELDFDPSADEVDHPQAPVLSHPSPPPLVDFGDSISNIFEIGK